MIAFLRVREASGDPTNLCPVGCQPVSPPTNSNPEREVRESAVPCATFAGALRGEVGFILARVTSEMLIAINCNGGFRLFCPVCNSRERRPQRRAREDYESVIADGQSK